MWNLDCEESWAPKNWCFWTVVLEKTLESPLDCKEIQPVHFKGDQSWVFFGRNGAKAETPILWPPSCEELTHWKRLWCWEGLGAGGEGDDRGWDGWMASPTRWTWVWVNSGRWWWTGRPGVLWFMGSQRVRHDWATELNWLIHSPQKSTWVHTKYDTEFCGEGIAIPIENWWNPTTYPEMACLLWYPRKKLFSLNLKLPGLDPTLVLEQS